MKAKTNHCAGIIIEKDGKILLNKRNYQPSKDKLDFVGGIVDPGESFKEAAIREAKEETNYDVNIIRKFISYNVSGKIPKSVHIFIAEIIGGKEKSSDEGQPVWIKKEDIKKENLAFFHTDFILNKYLEQL